MGKVIEEMGFLRQLWCSEEGIASSKRVLGSISIIVCLGITVYEAVMSGITDNIKDLIEVFIFTGSTLLGITSITDIWKKKAN